MPLFSQITIIGVGLIGGSLAKSIRKKSLCKKIVGFFRNGQKLNKAIKEKIVDEGYLDLKKSVYKSDLVILALPISQIISFMKKIKKIADNGTLIIDVGSTKLNIMEIANKLKLNFIGVHPLAGSEKSGMNFSSHKLFENSKVILTPTKKINKQTFNKIKLFWKKLNAETLTLSAREHDRILAYTSHLPHLVSFCLINSIPEDYLKISSSGLRDSTRIALSDAQIWSDILVSNKKELLVSLSSFEYQIKRIKKIIQTNKTKRLIRIINNSRIKREKIV